MNTEEHTTTEHYDKTRQPILNALSNIASRATDEESKSAAQEMASCFIYASGGNLTSLLIDIKKHAISSRALAYLIESLGFVPLGSTRSSLLLLELLQTFAGDSNIHIREAAENALDMINFDIDPL